MTSNQFDLGCAYVTSAILVGVAIALGVLAVQDITHLVLTEDSVPAILYILGYSIGIVGLIVVATVGVVDARRR